MFQTEINKIKDFFAKPVIPEFENYYYKQVAEDCIQFEDKIINKFSKISFCTVGTNGLYIFIASAREEERIVEDIIVMTQMYSIIDSDGVFVFVRTQDKDYFYDNNQLHEIEYMLDRFTDLFNNTLRPQIDLIHIGFKNRLEMLEEPIMPEAYLDADRSPLEIESDDIPNYVQPLLDENTIKHICKEMEVDHYPKRTKYIFDEDGNKYIIKKKGKTVLGAFWFGDNTYYPVVQNSADHFILFAIFGGWFGLHKFITRDYKQGLLYLITCGGFMFGYIYDVYAIATGSYNIINTDTQDEITGRRGIRIYLDQMENKWLGVAGIIASIFISIFTFKYIFMNVVEVARWVDTTTPDTSIVQQEDEYSVDFSGVELYDSIMEE